MYRFLANTQWLLPIALQSSGTANGILSVTVQAVFLGSQLYSDDSKSFK